MIGWKLRVFVPAATASVHETAKPARSPRKFSKSFKPLESLRAVLGFKSSANGKASSSSGAAPSAALFRLAVVSP